MIVSAADVPDHIKALLIALNVRDNNTGNHCNRTCTLSLRIGERCCLSSQELTLLGIAALVHDIGKIGIPDHILLKPGRLNDDEWDVMKTHPDKAHQILSSMQTEEADALARIVLHHHESFDGSGYPAGLSGEDIPVMSRIIALADSYDAMATPRSYHRSRSPRDILEILYGEDGHKYDPYLRNQFAREVGQDSLTTSLPM